jgi:hypothetical protein
MADERLRSRILADRSDPAAYDATLPGSPAGSWPALDAVVLHAPDQTVIDQNQVLDGLDRGYMTAEGHQVVVRPAGPADNPWLVSAAAPTPHVFHHFERITIGHAAPVTYRVTRQPDKYVRGSATDEVTDAVYAAGETEVLWHYELERES